MDPSEFFNDLPDDITAWQNIPAVVGTRIDGHILEAQTVEMTNVHSLPSLSILQANDQPPGSSDQPSKDDERREKKRARDNKYRKNQKEKFKGLGSEVKELTARNKALENENASQKEEIDWLAKALEQHKEHLCQLHDTLVEQKTIIAEMSIKIGAEEDLKNEVKELTERNKALENENASLKKDVDRLDKAEKQQEKDLCQLQDQLVRQTTDIAEMSKALATHTRQKPQARHGSRLREAMVSESAARFASSYENMTVQHDEVTIDVDPILRAAPPSALRQGRILGMPGVTPDQLVQNPGHFDGSQALSRTMITMEELQRELQAERKRNAAEVAAQMAQQQMCMNGITMILSQMIQNNPSLFSQQAGLLSQLNIEQQGGSSHQQPIVSQSVPTFACQPSAFPSFTSPSTLMSQQFMGQQSIPPFPLNPSAFPPFVSQSTPQGQQQLSRVPSMFAHPHTQPWSYPSSQYPKFFQPQLSARSGYRPELPIPTSNHVYHPDIPDHLRDKDDTCDDG